MAEQLVDSIYEAAFVPERWHDVLQQMSDLSASASASLLLFDGPERPPRYRATPVTQELLRAFTTSDDWKHTVCVRSLTSIRPGTLSRFFYLNDYLTPEQRESERASLRLSEAGLGEQITARVPLPSGETAAFSLERWEADGRHQPDVIAELDQLRPHLARAGLIAARLWFERAEATVTTLAALRLPAAVLNGTGKVLAVNEPMQALKPLFFPAAFGRIAIADQAADTLLGSAIAAIAAGERSGPRSIPIPGTEHYMPHVVHVLPVSGSARDVLSGGLAILVVSVVGDNAAAPPLDMLSVLFDLTPAEARLAGSLMVGRSVAEAAEDSGISVKSARTYLDRVFHKTGTHRQSELISLLRSTQLAGGAANPPPGDAPDR